MYRYMSRFDSKQFVFRATCNLLAFVNSAINVFIYSGTDARFCRAAKKDLSVLFPCFAGSSTKVRHSSQKQTGSSDAEKSSSGENGDGTTSQSDNAVVWAHVHI